MRSALGMLEAAELLVGPPAVMHHDPVEVFEDADVFEGLDASFRVRDEQRQQAGSEGVNPCLPGRQRGAGLVRAQHRRCS